jgi:hypothetical protein
MTRRAGLLSLLLISAALTATTVRGDEPLIGDMSWAGPYSMSGDWSITAYNVHRQADGPTLVFGTAGEPDRPLRCSYALLVRAGPGPRKRLGFDSSLSLDGVAATSSMTLHFDDATFAVAQRLSVDRAAGRFSAEELRVEGELIDPAHGRAFVLDLTGPVPSLERLDVALPDLPPRTDDTAAWTREVGRLLMDAMSSSSPR